MTGVTAPREKTFLLAAPEQRVLEAIARRLPAGVRPDHLTALALAAAVAFAVAAASGAFAAALIGVGLGLSAHMHVAAGLVLVVAYLALSINSYLETQALGRFSLGYGRLGPTEARLGLIALLLAVALGAEVSVAGLTLLDLTALAASAAMLLALAARAAGNLRLLATREPYTAP